MKPDLFPRQRRGLLLCDYLHHLLLFLHLFKFLLAFQTLYLSESESVLTSRLHSLIRDRRPRGFFHHRLGRLTLLLLRLLFLKYRWN